MNHVIAPYWPKSTIFDFNQQNSRDKHLLSGWFKHTFITDADRLQICDVLYGLMTLGRCPLSFTCSDRSYNIFIFSICIHPTRSNGAVLYLHWMLSPILLKLYIHIYDFLIFTWIRLIVVISVLFTFINLKTCRNTGHWIILEFCVWFLTRFDCELSKWMLTEILIGSYLLF